MRFIAIKNVSSYNDIVVSLFKSLVGNNLKYENIEDELVIYFNYENVLEIKDLLKAFEGEALVSIKAYISKDSTEEEIKKEYIIHNYFINDLKPGVYDLKEALINADLVINKREILNYILDNTGVSTSFIKEFVSYDLNVSRASKEMYIHRNTMNYKLDKLREMSGFDLRVFKDAYILYMLVEK